jgi:dTDP-4-dehydrorhamnose 3,5-epimerase
MIFQSLRIPDVVLIKADVFEDQRGCFVECWNAAKFKNGGIDIDFVQMNQSTSRKGVLRGLHYQIAQPQGKLIRVNRGEIFDVVVDIRRSSPSFGAWVSERLSAENRNQLWVPEGFAHGFLTLSDAADVTYLCTELYAPQYERILLWNDPELQIEWPSLDIEPLVSHKDALGLPLLHAETFA